MFCLQIQLTPAVLKFILTINYTSIILPDRKIAVLHLALNVLLFDTLLNPITGINADRLGSGYAARMLGPGPPGERRLSSTKKYSI